MRKKNFVQRTKKIGKWKIQSMEFYAGMFNYPLQPLKKKLGDTTFNT